MIKYNVNLYISQKALWQWLKKWFSQEELLSKVEDDVLKGNLKVSKIPTPYDSDQFIFLGDEIFRLDRFGLCLDKKTLGHIEIKYQSLENPSNEFIINFHVEKDQQKRTSEDYHRIILSIFRKVFKQVREYGHRYQAITLKGFRREGFEVASHSTEYYLPYMLWGLSIARQAEQIQIAQKQSLFLSLVDECAWATCVDGNTDPDCYLNLGGKLIADSKTDCAFTDLTPYSRIFAPVEEEYTFDDFRDGGVGYYTESFPCHFYNFIFAHCDMRKLDFWDASFYHCDFAHADLRGVRINLDKMDDATLITLTQAKIDNKLKKDLEKRLSSMCELRPHLITSALARLC